MRALRVVLGDQLFDPLPREESVFMREDWGLCRQPRHHQQKLVLFLASMRHYAARLGSRVLYQGLAPNDQRTYAEALTEAVRNGRFDLVRVAEPADASFHEVLAHLPCPVEIDANPSFLTSKDDWTRYCQTTRRRHMAHFYAWQRRRLDILMEGGEPTGGRWSFDEDNRKPLPRGHTPPYVRSEPCDEVARDVIELVTRHFGDHPGNACEFACAVTHQGARAWLEAFLEERFAAFGDYEDAISGKHDTLYHSLLSPYLNTGLLTPAQVLEAALAAPGVPLNAREGFVRQLIGWREFIRGIDRDYGPNPAPMTALGHHRKLGAAWWTGETGLPPIDAAIRRCLRRGWCHHIERLMVLGAPMLMAEVDPAEAYRWFMEMFIDSAEWVMRPNVFGMSQFADGGLFATKPYISGSAYILKMSDYPKGPWCEVWDGLYWRFVARHRELLAKNPRTSATVHAEARLDPVRRERIVAAAEAWIARVTV